VVTEDATALIPDRPSLKSLRRAAADCRACPLWKDATQTVFGEGRKKSAVMMVGEQPGDHEDLEGHPFVGPAGRLLGRALGDAGLDLDDVYLTNMVKHFKWTPKGKRRIHKKPNLSEIAACRPWLDAELKVVQPRGVVCLGATAAQALLGRDFRVSEQRGVPVESEIAELVVATVHPSSILRAGDDRAARYELFVADLKVVAQTLDGQ
jgi:DNA polymerase